MGILLDHFLNKYPYTDFHELNADWMIRTMMELINQVENFVSLNAIKYADPIQWSIVRQYEKNTIVIDPLSGTAYISVKPVPIGVALTNTDYWTVVFDLGSFVVRAAKNFTNRYEAETTLTATFPSSVGDWLVWGDILYEVISPIVAGDQYVVGSNIKNITMEETIGHLTDLVTTNKTSIVAAINEVLLALWTATGDLDDLNTTDKTNLVNAINEVLSTLINTAGVLANLNTTDKTSLVNAINEVLSTLINTAGVLDDLNTTDKTNLVNAINEVLADVGTETTNRVNADTALTNMIYTRETNWYNRHFLFVGDSYGDESGEWADLIITLLNLGSRATNLCVGGASFHDPTPALQFATQIANYTGDKSEITDIVICGGLNDSISANALDYTTVTDGMDAFNAIVLSDYPYANVSIGYIGNGDDLDPSSLIGIRTYAARQCCKYIYYNRAAVYGWNILHNVEYLLTGYAGFIGADGVHPSAAGSSALYIGIAQALRNGSADYNYPITSLGLTNALGLSMSGDINYKIHNDAATLSARTLVFNINTGTQFTSGVSIPLATFANLYFNDAVNILCSVRMYNPDIDSTPTTEVYYTTARLTFYKNQLLITVLDADGTTNHIFTYNSAGYLVLADFDFVFGSMILK